MNRISIGPNWFLLKYEVSIQKKKTKAKKLKKKNAKFTHSICINSAFCRSQTVGFWKSYFSFCSSNEISIYSRFYWIKFNLQSILENLRRIRIFTDINIYPRKIQTKNEKSSCEAIQCNENKRDFILSKGK